ncbi:hypothetical protein OG21DRAFT_1479656 [Imleria badia]|nr:hypothetical protein OG21DRAFT_1479656 [Imleria badia]
MIARLQKEWNSHVYAFFDPTPTIRVIDGRRAHEFQCCARSCKVKIRRYLDTKDARSTGNLRKHVKVCWGEEVLKAADEAKHANDVRTNIVGGILRNGSITAAFERNGKGDITYKHMQHTRAETRAEIIRWVAEDLRPYQITGRPEYYLPSPETVSRDVRQVFVHTRKRIAKIYHAYVAFCVHLQHKGETLSFPLDIIELGKVVCFPDLIATVF